MCEKKQYFENSFQGKQRRGRKRTVLFAKRDLNIVLNAKGDVFRFLQQQKRLLNSVDADLEQMIEFVHFGLDL